MWKLQGDGLSNKLSTKDSNTITDDEGNVWVFGCDTDEARHNASKLTGSLQQYDLKRVSEQPLADNTLYGQK